jgi:sugar phosphate permease
MICFALSSNFYLSLLFLILSGIADSISVIIRQSTYQAHTPHELRGRIASVNGIFIRSSNEIGAFESGLAAQLLGTIPSVLFGGIIAIGVVGVMQWKIPSLESDTPR